MKIIDTNNNYKIAAVISVYKRDSYSADVPVDYYLQNHEVYEQSGSTLIGAGQPMTQDTMDALAKYFRGKEEKKKQEVVTHRKGMMPANLLYLDAELQKYVWLKPAHTSHIKFANKGESQYVPDDGPFHHPTLIFKATPTNIWVTAIKGVKAPAMDTDLYPAPYLNMHSQNDMCLGTITTKGVSQAETHRDFISSWEAIFFHTKFSTGLGADSGYKKMVEENRKRKDFDESTLKESSITLSEFINR